MFRFFKVLNVLAVSTTWMLAQPQPSDSESGLVSSTFQGLKLRPIGPALMSGRISDVVKVPGSQKTWYVAVGSGGVWKTVNAGTTWIPIFDREQSYSIGCLALDPANPETVWVGTGENVSGRHVGFGDGVYRSLDGGESWKRMGLEKSEHISKILIDPRDSKVVLVASEGPLWSSGGERGVYKSIDGGSTWQQVLSISPETGVADLEFDPRNFDVLYAAAYQRRRTVWSFLAGGPESGLYKSTDGGKSWRKLEKGLPKGDVGKIGIAVSPIDPSHVYATIEATEKEKGFYRSLDFGESWEKRNDYVSGATGPHYYQEIYASPHRLDRVYQMDVWISYTEDGGKTFRRLGEPFKHPDNHALVFDPEDPDYLLAGSDGGIYETWDHGRNWRFTANLPVTQFYKLALDNALPFYNITGGTQDNNSQLGPSRTLNAQGIRNEDWIVTLGGDGYACQIDPVDPNIVYSEWQIGGLVRFDRRTGQKVDIKPQPRPDEPPERWNWDAPILISPHKNTRLYFGSQRIWRSEDRGNSWQPISGDLTRDQNRYELKVAGRVWSVDSVFDHNAMSHFNSTTSISESPVIEGLIYAGTDDGLIQVTEDGGKSWRRIGSLPGIPELFFVNEIKASASKPDRVYAAVDHHKTGNYRPFLFRSDDRGRTWVPIAGDLPDRHLVWAIADDHENANLLFAGTEFGIYFTLDGGARWIKLGGDMPTISVRDLEIQRRENDLVAASFGRGFFILDDYSCLRHLTEEELKKPSLLFPVKQTLQYVPAEPLGEPGKAMLGAAYFTAPNPPFGAIFTYYLAEDLKTLKQQRRDAEQTAWKEGRDLAFPGWERLQQELRDEEPGIVLTVRDSLGKVVRRLTAEPRKGFHRVAWDLRQPSLQPVQGRSTETTPFGRPATGTLVAPGTYSVSLSKLVNGNETSLGSAVDFEVVPLGGASIPDQDSGETQKFFTRVADLQRLAAGAQRRLSEIDTTLSAMKEAAARIPDGGRYPARIRALQLSLYALKTALSGDEVRERLSEPDKPAILTRIQQVYWNQLDSTYGPTKTHQESLAAAASAFESFKQGWKALEQDLADLDRDLAAAGAPWTPGRMMEN